MSRRFSVSQNKECSPPFKHFILFGARATLSNSFSLFVFVFSEQNPEQFKSASSRNHQMRHLSESSCLPNQAGFEASCFLHPRQEKRERIWPLYQFFVVCVQGTVWFVPEHNFMRFLFSSVCMNVNRILGKVRIILQFLFCRDQRSSKLTSCIHVCGCRARFCLQCWSKCFGQL